MQIRERKQQWQADQPADKDRAEIGAGESRTVPLPERRDASTFEQDESIQRDEPQNGEEIFLKAEIRHQ